MSESFSRVSSKYQTVIPKAIRTRLSLRTGDILRFRVDPEGAITLEKVKAAGDDPFAAFDDWNSNEDDRLYRNL